MAGSIGEIIGLLLAVAIVVGSVFLVVKWRNNSTRKRLLKGWEYCGRLIDKFDALYEEWQNNKTAELKNSIETQWLTIKNAIRSYGLTDESGTGSLDLDRLILETKSRYNDVKNFDLQNVDQ